MGVARSPGSGGSGGGKATEAPKAFRGSTHFMAAMPSALGAVASDAEGGQVPDGDSGVDGAAAVQKLSLRLAEATAVSDELQPRAEDDPGPLVDMVSPPQVGTDEQGLRPPQACGEGAMPGELEQKASITQLEAHQLVPASEPKSE